MHRLYICEVDDDVVLPVYDSVVNSVFELFDVGCFDSPYGEKYEDRTVAPLCCFDGQVVD